MLPTPLISAAHQNHSTPTAETAEETETGRETDTASEITGLAQEAPLSLFFFHFNTSACFIGGYLSLKSSPQQHYNTISNPGLFLRFILLGNFCLFAFKTCPTSSPHLRWRSPGCRDTYLTESKSWKESGILGFCRGFCPVRCAAKPQGRGRGRHRVLTCS